ncbi:MAG: HlyC/CorC family transporter [Gemmatimonadota bacterium]|nr:MAG: HlyC/CorC family transporter [Gemmatimonadota bacterium]
MEEITLASLVIRSAAVAVLLAANAFFVAAEFALVAARRTKVEEMVRQGDRKAKTVQAALQDLYRQLSAAQLGITLASILLGYVAEDTIAVLLHDWFARLPSALEFLTRGAIVSVVAVAVITALHVVVGEQAPKAWAITFPEATSRWIAAPLISFSWITRPVTNFLNFSSNRLVRLLGIKGSVEELEGIHSPEEIVMLVKQSLKSGQLEHHDVEMIEGVFEFTEKSVRAVMTPRTDVIALPIDATREEILDLVAATGRSRYPVYRKSLDDIAGIVLVKQLLGAVRPGGEVRLADIMREPLFVPRTREIEDVLADMKRAKLHMAVVLDEYGGTAGIVTMEDLIEEIVGEIYDEYDEDDIRPDSAADATTVPGTTELAELSKRFGWEMSTTEYQTIGGFVFGRLGRLPKVGDSIRVAGLTIEVLVMDGRRVDTVKISVTPASSGTPDSMDADGNRPVAPPS